MKKDVNGKLYDQVAIITGAGRNIGEAMAKLFAAEGAKIAVVDMDKTRCFKVVEEIQAEGGEAFGTVTDITSSAAVQSMVAGVVKHWGKINILVNNVAFSDNKTILDISEELWNQTLAVTLTGTFLVSKYVAAQMVQQGQGGKIVNLGSTSAYFGRKRAIAYTTAKGGILNLTRSMAAQLAQYNIRVNSVSPNKVGSPVGKDTFDPTRPVTNLLKRPGEPIEVAKAVLFLVSDDSGFIVGEDILVDGGVKSTMPGE